MNKRVSYNFRMTVKTIKKMLTIYSWINCYAPLHVFSFYQFSNRVYFNALVIIEAVISVVIIWRSSNLVTLEYYLICVIDN